MYLNVVAKEVAEQIARDRGGITGVVVCHPSQHSGDSLLIEVIWVRADVGLLQRACNRQLVNQVGCKRIDGLNTQPAGVFFELPALVASVLCRGAANIAFWVG